ncbi:MAG: hypothetical protein HLX51_09775 [Micrococcaceae bacterium]|nr:hypothetical protein [Micrococcaceae bacterium]
MADNANLPPRPKRIPPHILRRRRIVAVIILLIILGLIGWGIWALVSLFLPDEQQDQPQPEPTVSESASPAPSESESPDDDTAANANACDPDVLAVTGATDQETYGADEFPTFSMTIAHEGDELCDASLGSDQQSFVVEDAEGEFVFSTRACQVDPQSQVVEMEPGQSEAVEFQWERVGTDESCETVVEDISAGEYQLVVGLGEEIAEPVTFELQ